MKLASNQLKRQILPEQIEQASNEDNLGPSLIWGQQRAAKALAFGIAMHQPGYNLYLAGRSGTGRGRYVIDYLKPLASRAQTPQDWLYVNNFDRPAEPRAIAMPPQQGIGLLRDIDKLIEALLATFPAVFEHPTYLQQKSSLQKAFDQTYEQAIDLVERRASSLQIALFREESSITFAPIVEGQAADEAIFAQLSEESRELFRQHVATLENLLNNALLELPQWQRDLNNKLRELMAATIKQSLKPIFDQLQLSYQGHPGVQLYLAQVSAHLPRVIEEYLGESVGSDTLSNKRALLEDIYRPNLLTRSTSDKGAPIVLETNPNYLNLFGRINYSSETAGNSSSYQQIMAGALHRANGGYLLLEVEKLLREPATWEALKRCLRDGAIHLEPPSIEQQINMPNLLKPESIPLQVKIVLIGPREIYYMLEEFDHGFDELFRVLVDFNSDIDLEADNLAHFANMVRQRAHEAGLAPLSTGAIARLSEYACRLAENQHKFSAAIGHIMEVAIEANYHLTQHHTPLIEAEHIELAIAARAHRNSRLHDQLKDEIIAGRIVISTQDVAVGQINGLSVIKVGESSFGCPMRITASVHPGSNGVVDIEREVTLGQPVHSKGVMILAGYLCARYAREFPLAISARIAMEQSYGYVDGDSASLAELCALLSALINLPLRQDLALTGSVNQRGEVQAIGGVNEKIEGFFDICRARGLSGRQGVIIPASNQSNLMLSDELIRAVECEQFSIYTVTSVDQTLELLTGITMGQENSKGNFPNGSANQRIVKRLKQFTQFIRQDSAQ